MNSRQLTPSSRRPDEAILTLTASSIPLMVSPRLEGHGLLMAPKLQHAMVGVE